MARMLTFSVEPNPGTGELEEKIVAAIREWVTGIRDESVMITADGALSDEWAALVHSVVLPQLGVEFIATGARAMPESGVSRDDQLIAWPPGVDGPPTVSGLLAEYPLTFAGVSAAQVTLIVASPTWTTRFAEYLRTTENLVVGMADTVFQDMQQALAKVGQGAPVFEKQQAVREFLSWEGEGGYEGWMRRAERIARTETATARNTAAHTAALDVANAGVPIRKVWSCAHDERTRPAHREADGQARDIAEPFTVGGEPLDHPGDRVHGSAKNTINCRCVCSYIEGEDAQDTIDWLEQFRGRSLADMEAEMDRELEGLAASGGEVTALAWEGRLAPLGEPTGDGRVFNEDGEFTFRTFPLPLLWQETTGEGHDQSRIVGTIDGGEITDGAITAHGTVFADEERVVSLLERGVIRPSVDLCDMVCEIEDDETGELLRVTSATVMAATLVAKPAFENVGVFLTGDTVDVTPSSLAASATVTLDEYRAASFEDPGLSMPTPVTVTETGRVYGHLALWDSCHIGMPGRCVKPPHSARGYAAFHQSTVHTDKGPLAVGRLTVGGGHASPRAGVRAAAEHYDRTGAAWAMVRAGEDEFGIWVSGQVCPSATREQINAGASAPLSGDWRDIGGNLELVAALSVSTPGFPVRREYTASDGETMSLVAAAEIPAPTDRELSDREVDVLAARVEERITRHRRAENLRHRFGQASERWRERKTRRVMDRAADVFTTRAKEQN